MIRTITTTFLMGSLLAISHPEKITLSGSTGKTTATIGHTHVFAEKEQVIQLRIPGEEDIKAQLFRMAGNTLAPAAPAILVSPIQDKPTPVSIDFPPSNKPTQYTLIFATPDKTRLNITVLPLDHLDRLRRITRKSPIVLINPPLGLTETLRQLNITSRIGNSSPNLKAAHLISFGKASSESAPIPDNRAKRLILVNPEDVPNRDVWVSKKPDCWQITVPHYYFNSEYLATATGQANLIHILLDSPETH